MERVILFAKAPRLGAVKTRLVPPLSPEEALGLHEAMLADQIDFLRTLRRPGRTVEVCLDHRQGPGDLGERLVRAFARAFDGSCDRALVLGADAPTLPRSLVEDALRRVADGADAAIVPALDGGYLAIALPAPAPQLFRDIPWGTEEVLRATWDRALSAGTRLALTGRWGDVDRASDLARLRGECTADPSRAPRTAALIDRFAVI